MKSAVEPLTKPVPVRVIVVAELPAVVELGLMLLSVGAGLLIEKVFDPDVPPPGLALTTVTGSVPDETRSEEGMTAVNDVALP